MRRMMKPVTVDAPSRPNIIGVISAPELVALMPSTPWNTSGVNRIEPNMPNAVRKPTTIATVNVGFLNSSSGTIGCSTRDSTQMNAASISAAKARRPRTSGGPRVVAGDGERDQERHDAGGEGGRAPEVDVAPRGLRADVGQARQHHHYGDDADRDVDLEDPAPAPVVGDPAAGGRADDRAEAEHGAEESLQAAALLGREEVADDGEDGGEQDAAEKALHAAGDDELGHVLGQAADGGRDHEAEHAEEQERLAPEQVAELAGDRGHGGRGDEVGGRDPSQAVEAVEVGHDARDGGADDRLVERGQEQRQHGAGGRKHLLAPGESFGDRLRHLPSSFLVFSTSNRHRCRSCSNSSLLNPATISN